jgi:hypothetical protein
MPIDSDEQAPREHIPEQLLPFRQDPVAPLSRRSHLGDSVGLHREQHYRQLLLGPNAISPKAAAAQRSQG